MIQMFAESSVSHRTPITWHFTALRAPVRSHSKYFAEFEDTDSFRKDPPVAEVVVFTAPDTLP
jgi:hypothetical protein